jgi:RNA polymerase sigma-70 factor, ECF subfamily
MAADLVLTSPTVRPAPLPGRTQSASEECAFEGLYRETVGAVHRYAMMLTRNPAKADDVVAEAYLRAWRARHSLADGSTPLAWLLTITRHCAIDAERKCRPEVHMEVLPDSADPEWEMRSAVSLADADVLREALQQLTAEQQQVILLRFYEELPHQEIAQRMGRSSGAIRAIQFRALARLRRVLEAEHVS